MTDEVIKLLREIARNTRKLKENVHKIYELDTSQTDTQTIHIAQEMGVPALSISVLDVGGGLYLATSDESPFLVIEGDQFENEDTPLLRWAGSGTAGTAIIRVGGVIGQDEPEGFF